MQAIYLAKDSKKEIDTCREEIQSIDQKLCSLKIRCVAMEQELEDT